MILSLVTGLISAKPKTGGASRAALADGRFLLNLCSIAS